MRLARLESVTCVVAPFNPYYAAGLQIRDSLVVVLIDSDSDIDCMFVQNRQQHEMEMGTSLATAGETLSRRCIPTFFLRPDRASHD